MQGSDFNRAFGGIVWFFFACILGGILLGAALCGGALWLHNNLDINIEWGAPPADGGATP